MNQTLKTLSPTFIITALFVVFAATTSASAAEATVIDFQTDSLVPHFRYHRRASTPHSASSSSSSDEESVDGSGQAAEQSQLNPVQLPATVVRATRDAVTNDDIKSDASGQEPPAVSIVHAQVKRHVASEAIESGSGELP